MANVSLTITLPDFIDEDFLSETDKAFLISEMEEVVAVRLFEQRRIGLGRGAEIAGVDRCDFVDLLNYYEIPVVISDGDL